MTIDGARTVATYAIVVIVLIACFALIFTGQGDQTQAWASIGLVTGYVLRDAGGAASTSQLLRVQAAQPTVTATSGPPATVTTTPGTPT